MAEFKISEKQICSQFEFTHSQAFPIAKYLKSLINGHFAGTSEQFKVGSAKDEVTLQLGVNVEGNSVKGTLRMFLYGKVNCKTVPMLNVTIYIQDKNGNDIKKVNLVFTEKDLKSNAGGDLPTLHQFSCGYRNVLGSSSYETYLPYRGELCVTITGIVITLDSIASSDMNVNINEESKKYASCYPLPLLQGLKYNDVTIYVDDKMFPAHKFVLWSRSEGFARLLEEMEATSGHANIITIDDFSANVVEECLHYIYTSSCPKLHELALDLFIFALKFKIHGLIKLCEVEALKSITKENIHDILNVAYTKGIQELKMFCIKAIKDVL